MADLSPGWNDRVTPRGFDDNVAIRNQKMSKNTYDPNGRYRCPNNHPMWNLYYKKVEGSTDTIVCCKACEK
jgi:hypothetical protein